MADPIYTDPVYPWTEARSFLNPDATRIEQNIAYINEVQVPAETTARETAITDEETARESADNAEAATRAAADTSLQTQIDDNINQSVKTTATPTFAGISSADATQTTLASGSSTVNNTGGSSSITVLSYNLRRPETILLKVDFSSGSLSSKLKCEVSTSAGWIILNGVDISSSGAAVYTAVSLNPGNYRFVFYATFTGSSQSSSGTYAIYRIGRFA